MSDTGDDVFTRLSGVIEDWSAQIAHSHSELSVQMNVARGHLDRLLSTGAEAASQAESALDAEKTRLAEEVAFLSAELVAAKVAVEEGVAARDAAERGRDQLVALEASLSDAQAALAEQAELVSALTEELDAVRAAAGDGAADDADGAVAALESALAQARAEMADQSEIRAALKEELDAANEQIEILAEQLRAARTVEPTAGEDVAALQSALELLQMEHAAAQDEIRSLRQALDAGGPIGAGIDAFDGRGHKKRMGEILVELGVLTEVQLKSLLKEQSTDPQRRLGAIAVEHGFTSEDLVSRILAAQLRLPYEDLSHVEPEAHAIEKVSPHVVRLHRCMPLQEGDGVLTVAMVNPLDLIAIEDLELASRCRVSPVVSTRSQIDALLEAHYPEIA